MELQHKQDFPIFQSLYEEAHATKLPQIKYLFGYNIWGCSIQNNFKTVDPSFKMDG